MSHQNSPKDQNTVSLFAARSNTYQLTYSSLHLTVAKLLLGPIPKQFISSMSGVAFVVQVGWNEWCTDGWDREMKFHKNLHSALNVVAAVWWKDFWMLKSSFGCNGILVFRKILMTPKFCGQILKTNCGQFN